MPVAPPTPRTTRRVRGRVVGGLAALAIAALLATVAPPRAAAVVSPRLGFRATVDGFTSWYGSYSMGVIGTAWCIDHGIASPDPAFAYVATTLPGVSAETRTAMAWLVGAHGHGTDPLTHAAVMLVLHDLMGARYASGPLDVDRLTTARVVGFGAPPSVLIERARLLKADALAHAPLRGPVTLTMTASPPAAGTVTVTVRLHDAGGRPLPGMPVRLDAGGARLDATRGTTTANGTWRTTAHLGDGPDTLRATAVVPRLTLDAWAPTTRTAQRVARPGVDERRAEVHLVPPPTTTTAPTTTTILPTTTTTREAPPTTTTTTTTTTTPSTTTTSTTAPPTTTTTPPRTTSTTTPPTTTTSTTTTTAPTKALPLVVPPTTAPPPPPPQPRPAADAGPPPTVLGGPPVAALPRTGRDAAALVLVALGLLLLGGAALDTATERAPSLSHHARRGDRRRR